MHHSQLFEPLTIGHMQVQHRLAMAPLTRFRATNNRVPTTLMQEYYSQRAAVPGTLLITEGTFVSAAACGGFSNAPGIWHEDQVAAWKGITDEVHRKGCYIFCQIFAMGRAANFEIAAQEGFPIVAPSAIPIANGGPMPRAMTTEEIQRTIQDFADASRNAIQAGFDGVEIHVANGYLLDQFLQDVSNVRQDAYGGSVENRSRLIGNVLHAVADTIGPERVGLRLSPWSTFQGMRMEDPIPQFTDIITKAKFIGIGYLHLVESRIAGSNDCDSLEPLNFAYDLWDGPLLVAGGFTPQEAAELVDEKLPHKKIVIVFGRSFISNPDLVFRIKQGYELQAYDRSTFYAAESPRGYIDYKYCEAYRAESQDDGTTLLANADTVTIPVQLERG